MTDSPTLVTRALFGLLRGFLVVAALLMGLIVGGVLIVPLTIFALPLPIILGGLLVLYVLGATQSMADDWHARRVRRRGAPAVAAARGPERPSRSAAPVHAVRVTQAGR